MLQLGLLRDSDEPQGRRRSMQPISHDSALPPGFGTLEQNGSNGARIGRRGAVSGGRRVVASSPSDPFGTGTPLSDMTVAPPRSLSVTGGYANGHPHAGGNKAGGGKASRGKPGGRNPRAAKSPNARAGGPGGDAASEGYKSAPQGRRKPAGNAPRKAAARKSGPRRGGDERQPNSAKAHESRLGVSGARGGRRS